MTDPAPKRPVPAWLAIAATGILLGIVIVWVDLTPRVETDFFFSPDDPQYRASAEIAERFPSRAQVVIRVSAEDIAGPVYRTAVAELTTAVGSVEGVTGVTSVTTQDADDSPLWGRILIPDGRGATNVLVDVEATDGDFAALVRRLEATTASFQSPALGIQMSGVPYVVELIRRNLFRDLAVFSSVALVVFGAIVAAIYRAWPIVAGTLAACLSASSLTLALAQLLGGSIGLLTANIATIVFVLTLSHIVFLTSNWRLCCAPEASITGDPVVAAVRRTLPASFWCMMTTLLGFLSLFLASAKPLRQLGMAGAIGTLTAIIVAYVMFPHFLRRVPAAPLRATRAIRIPLRPRRGGVLLLAFGAVVALSALGVPRVITDPSLLSYFAQGDPLLEGLEAIDRDGGSSPLHVVVADANGLQLVDDDVIERMWQLQLDLEANANVGSVVSPALIVQEIRRTPFVGNLPLPALLALIRVTPVGRTIAAYLHPDRDEGLFFLRMREAGRTEERSTVIDRIRDTAEQHDLRPVLVGGLYEQQGALGGLIASSLRFGLGGLVTLFLVIAFLVSRDTRVTLAMVGCLAGIPLVVLGTMGHAAMPIDIVSSPAANVALAMGVDSMIHLMMRARRLQKEGISSLDAWSTAQRELAAPIVGAAFIISAGFGIFSLSTFPPTQRFGLAVILGTLTAAATALWVLPVAVAKRK